VGCRQWVANREHREDRAELTAADNERLRLNPAYQISRTESGLVLSNPFEGSRLKMPEEVARVFDRVHSEHDPFFDRAEQKVVAHLLRLRVLARSEHVSVLSRGVVHRSEVPVSKNWTQEVRNLSKPVFFGCAVGFGGTEFGDPATGVIPIRRQLSQIIMGSGPQVTLDRDNAELGTLESRILDYGDVVYDKVRDTAVDVHDRVRFSVDQIMSSGGIPMMIGGDHSITYPAVLAALGHYPALKLVHFDAHTDRRDILKDGKLPVPDCGNFIEHLLRNVPSLDVMTIGLRGWTRHPVNSTGNYRQIPVRKIRRFETSIREFCRDALVYLTLDIDVLDPSIAPEVAYASPAGLMLRELQDLLDLALENSTLVGADFVEACDWNARRNLAVWSQVAAITTVLEHLLIPKR
jgi:arginase family enzyme